jgi:hypothetical protein
VGTSSHLVPTSEFGNHFQRLDCDLGGQNVNELVATTFCAPIVVAKSAFADLKVVAQMEWERGWGTVSRGQRSVSPGDSVRRSQRAGISGNRSSSGPRWTPTTYIRAVSVLSGVQKAVIRIRHSELRIGVLSGVIGLWVGSL